MTPEFKRSWVEALRSGDYEQGRSTLRNPYGEYCCLGVLCDLVDPDGWKGVEIPDEDGSPVTDYRFVYRGDEEWEVLPLRLRDEAGLTADQQDLLTLMNDGGDSFEEIAEHIEHNL